VSKKPKPLPPTREKLQRDYVDARRAIEQVPGAYKQHGMMIRLEQAAVRLGLKAKPR
jgi:hypothetical protein